MFYEFEGHEPILVEVRDGRWTAHSLHPVPTPREIFLGEYLTELGGVNESIPAGFHHFNVESLDSDTHVVSLTPVNE